MKKNKLIYILGFSVLFLFFFNIFKPIKTNYIYNKEINFSENELNYKNIKISEDKIIKKAEEYIKNLFGEDFSLQEYNTEVSFDNYSKIKSVSVLFLEKNNKKNVSYVISFDLDSGEVINIYNSQNGKKTESGNNRLSEKELRDIAIEFLSKINKYSKYDFVLKPYFKGDICRFRVNLKEIDKEVYIELNSITGTVLSYGII